MQRRVLRTALSGVSRNSQLGSFAVSRSLHLLSASANSSVGTLSGMSRTALWRGFASQAGKGKVVILEKETDFGKIVSAKGTVIVDFYAE